MPKIGVLALQGAFIEHIQCFERLGAQAIAVRLPRELEGLEGLVIPGGESTSISRLMESYDLTLPLRKLAKNGFPMWGTCAGLILMASKVAGLNNRLPGVMNIEVRRNAFGRQVDSFEVDLPVAVLGELPFHAVFIRAPWIESVGPEVEVLARLSQGPVVAARQGKLLVTAFHPELTADLRFHQYFLKLVAANQ